jgi:hypothetical protein
MVRLVTDAYTHSGDTAPKTCSQQSLAICRYAAQAHALALAQCSQCSYAYNIHIYSHPVRNIFDVHHSSESLDS